MSQVRIGDTLLDALKLQRVVAIPMTVAVLRLVLGFRMVRLLVGSCGSLV